MSNSVVGFDVGSCTSYVVIAKHGGVESVANEYSERNTPSCISFNEKMRFIGHEAKQQQISNIKNTICGFNRLIGKTIADSMVINETTRNLCSIVEADEQRVGFQVNYLGKTHIFSAEQVYAMQLSKLKDVAEMNLKTKVVDVVINVPTNATDSERRAIFDGARIANLNCTRIINDTTACALAYGCYCQDLPDLNDKSRVIAFVDMGFSNLQSALVAFNKGKMRVIASSCDNIGGRDFDEAIYRHIKRGFNERYKLKIDDDKKPGVRLMLECEKLKKLMNANSTSIPMNIECFMNDIDVSASMCRSEFEKLASKTLYRVRTTLEKLLRESGLTVHEVDSVEIVGGSTRVSAVKYIIADVFKQELRTSLNSDEAVAKGCAIQCAILSPARRVKEFSIFDVCPYPIVLSYDDVNGPELVEIYPKWNQFPTSKQMTFKRKSDFQLMARYGLCSDLPTSNDVIGIFHVAGVRPGPDGDSLDVKVKMRINANGIFTCCQAQQVSGETSVNLPMEAIILQYMATKISEYNERENQMIVQANREKEKDFAKNSVEEYVYKMRDEMSGGLERFVDELERDGFLEEMRTAETWLYEEGEDVAVEKYRVCLSQLSKTGDKFVRRFVEAQERPMAIEEFGRVCAAVQRTIAAIDSKDDGLYSGLSAEDREVLAKVVAAEQAWFSEVMLQQRSVADCEDPVVTVADIHHHTEALRMVAGPIIDRCVSSSSSSLFPVNNVQAHQINGDTARTHRHSSDMDLD